jgi:hypothetical protein
MGEDPDNVRRWRERYLAKRPHSRMDSIEGPFVDITDLDLVQTLSGGRVDLTYGRYALFAPLSLVN